MVGLPLQIDGLLFNCAVVIYRGRILAYAMPGFVTSERTLQQARRLMTAIGCLAHEIDIRPSCMQILQDIPLSGSTQSEMPRSAPASKRVSTGS